MQYACLREYRGHHGTALQVFELQLLILITSEVGVLVRSVKVLVSKAISAPRICRGIVAQFTAGG